MVIDVLTGAQRQAVEKHFHVGQRADRHADPPDFASAWGASES